MISKSDIVKIVKKVQKRGKGVPERRLMHPARDWSIGLLLSSTIFLILSAYMGYSFMERTKNVDEATVIDSSVIIYKSDLAQDVLEKYRDKNKSFERLRNDRSNVPPPPVITEEESGTEEVSETSELAE